MLTGSNDVHPDLHLCNHLLMFGTSYGFVAQMNAMGLSKEMADARARGMKLTVVDPVLSYAASQADEWVPIRPGTDTAFALALMREWVIELDHYDKEFLRRYTNATYLIGQDGRYVRDPATGKPLVGNAATGTAQAFDAVAPEETALEGTFTVDGQQVQPQLRRLHGAPRVIHRRARRRRSRPSRPPRSGESPARLVEAAQIGQTITLDGRHAAPASCRRLLVPRHLGPPARNAQRAWPWASSTCSSAPSTCRAASSTPQAPVRAGCQRSTPTA